MDIGIIELIASLLLSLMSIVILIHTLFDQNILKSKTGSYNDKDVKKYHIQIYSIIIFYVVGIFLLAWLRPLQIPRNDPYYLGYLLFSMATMVILFIATYYILSVNKYKLIEHQWQWVTRIIFISLMLGTIIEVMLYNKVVNYYTTYIGFSLLLASLIFAYNSFSMATKLSDPQFIEIVLIDGEKINNVVSYTILKDSYVITIGKENDFYKYIIDKNQIKLIRKKYGELAD